VSGQLGLCEPKMERAATSSADSWSAELRQH
jgi:hypothetical protein